MLYLAKLYIPIVFINQQPCENSEYRLLLQTGNLDMVVIYWLGRPLAFVDGLS